MASAILHPESPHALPQVLWDGRRPEGREIDHAHGPPRAQARVARYAPRERELERTAAQAGDPKVDVQRLAQPAGTKEFRSDREAGNAQVSLHHEIAAEGAVDARLEPVLERAAEKIEKARIENDARRVAVREANEIARAKGVGWHLPVVRRRFRRGRDSGCEEELHARAQLGG